MSNETLALPPIDAIPPPSKDQSPAPTLTCHIHELCPPQQCMADGNSNVLGLAFVPQHGVEAQTDTTKRSTSSSFSSKSPIFISCYFYFLIVCLSPKEMKSKNKSILRNRKNLKIWVFWKRKLRTSRLIHVFEVLKFSSLSVVLRRQQEKNPLFSISGEVLFSHKQPVHTWWFRCVFVGNSEVTSTHPSRNLSTPR